MVSLTCETKTPSSKKLLPISHPQIHFPFAKKNTKNLEKCAWSQNYRIVITEDPFSRAQEKPPAHSGYGMRKLIKSNCHCNVACAVRKAKLGPNKDQLYCRCSQENPCYYFYWVPETHKYGCYPLTKQDKKKSKKNYLVKDFIVSFCNSLNLHKQLFTNI